MRRIRWKTLFLVSILAICTWGALQKWHHNELDIFVDDKVSSFTKKNMPMTVHLSQVELQLLPPALIVQNLRFEPHRELLAKIDPFTIEKVTIQPSLMHLLIGRFHLSHIDIEKSKLQIHHTIEPSKEEFKIELEKTLRAIPVTQIAVHDLDIQAQIVHKEQKYILQSKNIEAKATNDLNNVLVHLSLREILAKHNDSTVLEKGFFETHFFLTEKSLVISDFKLKERDSFLVASGSTQHSLLQQKLKHGKLNVRAFMKASHGKDLTALFLSDDIRRHILPIDGSVKTDLRIDITSADSFQLSTKTQIFALQYDNFKIGDISLQASYENQNKTIHLEKAQIQNNGLKAEIQSGDISIKDLSMKDINLKLEKFDLNSYLKYAISKDIPAHAMASGQAKCQGNFKPFKIDCDGSVSGNKLLVNPNEDKPLLSLNDTVDLKGVLSITDKDVSYRTDIQLPHSSGNSDGIVNYKTGFNVHYSTPNLDVSKIEKISGIEIGGKAKIEGVASGNSQAATFDLTLDGKSMMFAKYKMGDVSHQLHYSKGNLTVSKIQGTLDSIRYLGQLLISFDKETISGKIQFPFIDLSIAQDAIKENLSIPVSLSGTGATVVQLENSPLNPDHLSFKAKSRLYNCKVDEQHIENADVDLTSEFGKIKINTLLLEENNSSVSFNGIIHLDKKEYELSFQSKSIHLDDIVYTTRYSTPTNGLFTANGLITGPFKSPNIDVKLESNNFQLANKKISPLLGDMQIHNNKMVIDFKGPNDLKFTLRNVYSLPDIHVEGTTKEFDVAPLLTSALQLDQVDDFKILLSSNFNLKIPREHPDKLSGYIFLPLFEIDTEKNKIKSSKDISLFLSNGKVNFSSFELNGTGGQIKLKSNSTAHPIDFDISGIFSLSFVHILTPFLETVEGQTTVSMRIQKTAEKFNFFGSAFVDNGYVKLPDIQHALENLKIDLLFNQDRININSLKSKFASGQLTGDGNIHIIGSHNVPTDLNLHLDNIDLHLPPQVNTLGSADFKLTGNWLPFQLSGTYKIVDGFITKEFTSDATNKVNPHEIFLPPALRDQDTSPLLLNLEIIPTAPLKIKNAFVDGKIQGQIKVTGTPKSPILGGQISFTKFTQLIFKDVIFRVRDSNIILNNTNPPNPELYILADSRYKGYDIEMLVQGTAEKPKFNLTSQPTLTQPEIISLLALGYTSNEMGLNSANTNYNQTGSSATQNQAMQVGTGVFGQNPLGKEFKNRFGVDVQFSSRFDSSSSVAVPTIGFSKKISEKTSFEGSMQTGKESVRSGKLRYELDRGFAATMSVISRTQEATNQNQGNNISDILGVDLEFRKEFK